MTEITSVQFRTLANVQAAASASARAHQFLIDRVAEARVAGATWEQLGEALGVSKQVAHYRFAHLMPRDG